MHRNLSGDRDRQRHRAPQGATQPATVEAPELQAQTASVTTLLEQTVAEIRTRLDAQFPKGPYLADSYLAETLHMAPKTLANRRAAKPGRYPTPLHLGGARAAVHERFELIDWLAREELLARATTVHRCT